MNRLAARIEDAQDRFASLLSSYLALHPTTRAQYIRYLSFQYHRTKDVQRYFLTIAAHPDLARRRRLRSFLVDFANEESCISSSPPTICTSSASRRWRRRSMSSCGTPISGRW